jgi:hypothetical protein
MRTRITTVAVAVLAASACGTASANNSGNTDCPAGFQRLSVTYLESIGPYIGPAYVDQRGNNNGYVCGLQLPTGREQADCQSGGMIACQLIQLGLPIYNFTDDDVPANQPPATGA